ncbi:MAG: hypothetical protein K5857_08235 [Lachnospiraceae bacterium]|nr:hypothetical protein [Lachnospiraceae bacterium]
MSKETRNKILFFLPPVILAVITWLWLFLVDGRWYSYKQEWPFLPLLLLHLLMPLFYFIMFIVRIVKHINRNTRSGSDVFYIVSSIILTLACIIGLFTFFIFTSGV